MPKPLAPTRLPLHRAAVPAGLAGLAVAISLAVVLTPMVAANPDRVHRAAPQPDPFVVHEWGTFTTLQGSNGVSLDGLQHEEEVLPPFVHSLTRRLPSPFRTFGDPSANVPVRRTRSKMETPVIYFHSRKPRQVNVRVDFVGGVLSHYFPAPTRMSPTPADIGDAPLDLASIGASFLEWDLDIEATASDDGIPAVARAHGASIGDDGNLYAVARQVDAARVRVASQGGAEYERFLFYRGLGSLNPSIRVISADGDRLTVHNDEGAAMPAAFAVEMRGAQGRFLALGAVDAASQREVSLAGVRFTDKKAAVAALSRRTHRALVAQGLYADEAAAMVRTWAASWFGEDGTRLVYVVPSPYADRTLPLSITPTPDALVRVFVGRLEYLTPAQERELAATVRDTGSPEARHRTAAMQRLASQGRFLEPKLRRLVALTSDAALRARGESLLAMLDAALASDAQRTADTGGR